MSENVMNLWDMSSKLDVATIPDFVKAKYMTLKIVPPKGKTVRDGLVSTVGMLSYESNAGNVELVKVTKDPAGYQVSFPKGKRGILATKYRGPKSWYRFFNENIQKFYQWGKNDLETGVNEFLTPEFAEKVRSEKVIITDPVSKEEISFEEYYVPDWATLTQAEKDYHLDKYFEDVYMYGFAKDYNLNVENNPTEIPQVGMVTDFYRRSQPPKEGERYPNVIVTKFAPHEGKDTLSGDYTMVDAEIAAAILDTLTRRQDTSFNPEDFGSEDSQDDFKLAA